MMQSATAARIVTMGLAVLTAVLRVSANLAGAFNFNPAGAVGLFGGSRLKSWQAFAIPLALMVATDLALAAITNNPEYGLLHPSRVWVYASFLVYVVIGRYVIGDSKNPAVILGGSALGAAQFFLITNFFEWLRMPEYYSRDVWGLLNSYYQAIPFSLNTLAGDMIFTPLAFVSHALISREPACVADERAAVPNG
jgi:hypothetical protein